MYSSRRNYSVSNQAIIGTDECDFDEFMPKDKYTNGLYDTSLANLISHKRGSLHSYNSNPLQRSNFYKISAKGSGDYRRIDIMFRFYRICNSLKIQNPDRIYKLFLTRLNKRSRLESSPRKLEIVVSALYYIDQCIDKSKNCTLRDILSRIPDCKINLKQFTRFVSKMSKELGIHKLPIADDTLLISNILDELRTFCLDNIELNGKGNLFPKTTTTVMSMNDFFELDRIMSNVDFSSSESTPDRVDESDEKVAKKVKLDKTCYKLISKLLGLNYEKIVNLSHRILVIMDDSKTSEDILDPSNRVVFGCKKTLITSILYIAISALKIPVTPNLMIRALNVVKSSFYRNYNKVISKLITLFSYKYHCKINDKHNLFSLVLVLAEDGSISTDQLNSIQPATKPFKSEIKNEFNDVIPKILKVEGLFNNSKSAKTERTISFSKTIKCLDILESTENNVPDGEKGEKVVIIYERNANRYVCRYLVDGKIKRKCFSVNYHGMETAYNLANAFSKYISKC